MRIRCRHRGMTLLEILVGMAITVTVLALAMVTVRSQQASYLQGQRMREAQDAGRRAVLAIEQKLRMAGLGIDPSFAFDFSYYGIVGGAGGEGWPNASLCPSTMNGCPRDSTTDADELVFYFRDPRFRLQQPDPVGNAWILTGVVGNTANVRAKPGDRFLAGQVMVAICQDPNRYAYFTVSQTTDPATAVAPVALQLFPSSPNDPFRHQDLATEPCFNGSYAFLVNRYRFHIRPVAAGGRNEPYLVLDTGTDVNFDKVVDSNDELLVARGIETIQFSYVLQNGQIAGETPGSPIQLPATYMNGTVPVLGDGAANTIYRASFPLAQPVLGKSPYFPSSWFPYSSTSQQRMLNHQGNIRAVRIGIIARSESPDPDAPPSFTMPGVTLLDFQGTSSTPAWLLTGNPVGQDRFVRARVEATVPTTNLTVRAMSLF